MAKHVNSASRMHDIVAAARKIPDGIAVFEVWARASNIEEADPARRFILAVESIGIMRDELEHIRQNMLRHGFSEDLYSPQLKHLSETVLNPSQTLAPWTNVRGNVGEEILLSLKFCSEILPHEEAEIAAEQMAGLAAEINELEALVEQSTTLPQGLKATIRRQLDRLRRAISQYNVLGAKALKEAANHAIVDVLENRAEVESNRDSPEVSRLGKLIRGASQLADGVIKADKVIESSNKLIALVDKLLQ